MQKFATLEATLESVVQKSKLNEKEGFEWEQPNFAEMQANNTEFVTAV